MEPQPTSDISSSGGSVDVWQFDTDSPPWSQTTLWGWLTPDERATAGRFRREADGNRYIARRGILRGVLADYMRMDPALVALETACEHCGNKAHGKPRIAPIVDRTAPTFSATSSGPVGFITVRGAGALGADVERISRFRSANDLIPWILADHEVAALREQSPAMLARELTSSWTRKEAILKALGIGLSVDVRLVSHREGGANRLSARLKDPPPPRQLRDWSVVMVNVQAGYVGAVAGHRIGSISYQSF